MKRKATALVMFHEKTIYNITFITKDGEAHTLYNSSEDIIRPEYQSITHMYTAVLILARNNNYAIPYYLAFGRKWYNIQWCDTERPFEINRYAYHGDHKYFS